MMKTGLKQVSVLALGLMMASVAWSADLSNISAAVDVAGSFGFSGSDDWKEMMKAVEKINDVSKWGKARLVEDSDAYRDVRRSARNLKSSVKGANEYIDKMKGEFDAGFRGNASVFSSDAVDAVKARVGDQIKRKAKDVATGKELQRLINEEVMQAIQQQADQVPKEGEGVPTIDVANMITALFNLDSVFGTFHENEKIRDRDTKMCSIMGISAATDSFYGNVSSAVMSQVKTAMGPLGKGLDGSSPGFQCCLKWAAQHESQMVGSMTSMDLSGMGTNAANIGKKIAECCKLSPELCLSVGAQKAECVSGAVAGGSSLEDGLKTCQVECGKKGYGAMLHNPDSEYNEKNIDKLVKDCEKEKMKWEPSPTVLSASELAPVLPSTVADKVK